MILLSASKARLPPPGAPKKKYNKNAIKKKESFFFNRLYCGSICHRMRHAL
jgi:hypothetical protein